VEDVKGGGRKWIAMVKSGNGFQPKRNLKIL